MTVSGSHKLQASQQAISSVLNKDYSSSDLNSPRKKVTQEQEKSVEVDYVVYNGDIHDASVFELTEDSSYTGGLPSEYETLMSVDELIDEWNRFESRRNNGNKLTSDDAKAPQQGDINIETTERRQLDTIAEQSKEFRRKMLLESQNKTPPSVPTNLHNQLSALSRDQQCSLEPDKDGGSGSNCRITLNTVNCDTATPRINNLVSTASGNNLPYSNPGGIGSKRSYSDTCAESPERASRGFLTSLNTNAENNSKPIVGTARGMDKYKDYAKAKMAIRKQPKLDTSLNEDYLDDSDAFSDNPDFMYLPKATRTQSGLPHNQNLEIDVIPSEPSARMNKGSMALHPDLRYHYQEASSSMLQPNIEVNTNLTSWPNHNSSFQLKDQHNIFYSGYRTDPHVASSQYSISGRYVPPHQGMPPNPLSGAYETVSNNQSAQPMGLRGNKSQPFQCIPPPQTYWTSQNAWPQYNSNQRKTAVQYPPYQPRSLSSWNYQGGESQNNAKSLSDATPISQTPVKRPNRPPVSGDTTFSQPYTAETCQLSPLSSPIKFNLPMLSEKKMKRESVTAHLRNPKERERAVELLESVAKSEGRDIKVVENFETTSTILIANGPVGSNTRGFIQKLFPNLLLTASIS
ncbi:hypothetical protein F5884DRAFT_745417 [Xylogone sp. PMI_703]|nr:hypothetical protein F5884DRAFT_745417 [Xylogone sp. PMI_703]